MKLKDDRNRMNNRRIAKRVDDMDTEGTDFASEENEAWWNFVCARNILAERYLSEATVKNQTYMDILDESGMNALVGDIDKLMSGKRVVDVEVKDAGQSAAVHEGEVVVLMIKAYEEELKVLEVNIRVKQNKVAELKAKIQELQTTVPPTINDPTSDAVEDLDETTQSHV
ncbi:hypothetical protein LIER_11676 [Lithospermum erythrorhizon]|uniref:Uncharacterized protein n=1 Tax=Lithospermum erythrorhizon TaxID=34254 RepID=A0AAV3PQC2_LITER